MKFLDLFETHLVVGVTLNMSPNSYNDNFLLLGSRGSNAKSLLTLPQRLSDLMCLLYIHTHMFRLIDCRMDGRIWGGIILGGQVKSKSRLVCSFFYKQTY